MEKYTFFYTTASPFSQHYSCHFTVDGVDYNCAEQYMMQQKAVLFKDEKMANQIMTTDCPIKQKKFGRSVRNFDPETWKQHCQRIVKTANIAKFSQNPRLLEQLLATRDTTLVEASPRDTIWGIGLGANNPKAQTKATWRGKNLLGYILTEVREELSDKG